MTSSPQSTELRFSCGRVEHSVLPPHRANTSTTEPFAFGVSFTGHREAVLATAGDCAHTRTFRPSTIGLNGSRAVTWLHVEEPAEGVDIYPSARLLDVVSTLTHCRWDDLTSFRQLANDDVVWAACVAFRTAAVKPRAIAERDAHTLIANLTMHVAVHHLGGHALRTFAGRLDPKIVTRVGAYLRQHTDRAVTLSEMASEALMSPYHFHRSFRRTVGLTPATFAMALRMERAHRLLALGGSYREAADGVGMSDLSYFRRSYRRFFSEPGRG
jgi:AraC-like DNA-binding protein